MADEKKRMYQYGSHEIDYDNYLENLNHNVDKYLAALDWNDSLKQEFKNTYHDLWTAYRLDDSDLNRFSSNAFGDITDNAGEFFQDEDEDTYYDSKGNIIGRHQYATLSDRKRKKYQGFDARNNVMKYFRDMAKAIIEKRNQADSGSGSNKFNFNDHGFYKFWSNRVNPAGGEFNMKPFLDLDELVNGRRSRANRSTYLAQQLGDYIADLLEKDYDFSENVFGSKEKYIEALEAFKAKLADGTFNAEDAQAALAAGIDQKFFDNFFTKYDVYKTEEEAKKEEEARKSEEYKKAYNEWVNQEWQKYNNNKGNHYNVDNGLNIGKVDDLFRGPDGNYSNDLFLLKFNKDTYGSYYDDKGFSVSKYLEAWLKENPFDTTKWNTEDLQAIMAGLVQTPHGAKKIDSGKYSGMYYIPMSISYDTNSAIIYDPTTGNVFKSFLADIPTIWEEIKRNANISNSPQVSGASEYYMHKNGGILKKLQDGGALDNFFRLGYKDELAKRAKSNDRTEKQQKAAERFIDSDYATGENDAGWETEEYFRLASAAADVASAITAYIPTVGTIASATTGVGSTLSNLVADIADDSVTKWDVAKNLGFGLGMDVIGLIPGVGTGAKTAKIFRTLTKIAPKVMKWLWMYSAATNAPLMTASWEKAMSKDGKMTSEDWRNIMESLNLIMSGAAAQGRGFKAKGKIDSTAKDTARLEKLADDKVVVNVKDASGTEKRILFEGDDAKAIKNAKTVEEVKAATIDKFKDLKDHTLVPSFRMQNPVPSWNPKKWQSPFGKTASQKDVYISNGMKFINTKGGMDYETAFTPAGQAWKEFDDAFVESKLAPLRKAAISYERNLGKKAAKLGKLDKEIEAKKQLLDGKKSTTLEQQLKDLETKSKSKEYLNWKADEPAIRAKLSTKEQQVRDLETQILDLDTQILKESDATKLQALGDQKKAKLQTLNDLKDERDKLRVEIMEFTELDKALEKSNLDALKDEIKSTKTVEKDIQDLLTERQEWDKFVEDGKTKERLKFEKDFKKDSEGYITFHDPATGRDIKKKFDELLSNIKFKKGGSIKKFRIPSGPLTYELQAELWRRQRNGEVIPTEFLTTPVDVPTLITNPADMDTSEFASRHLGLTTGSEADELVEQLDAVDTKIATTGRIKDGVETAKQQKWWEGVGNEVKQGLTNLMQDPNIIYGIPRAAADMKNNRRITNLMILGEKPILKQRLNLSPITTYSDLAGEMAAQSNAALLINIANQPLTSDSRLQTALLFDALLKGQQIIDLGKQKSDSVYLLRMEDAKKQRDIEDTKNLQVANENIAAMLATQNNIKKHQANLLSKEQTIKDTLSQAFEKDYRTRQIDNAKYDEALFKKDQKALELDNAINGKYAGEFTPSQIRALKLYKEGNTSGMRQVELDDLNKALAIIENKVLTAWATKRGMSRIYNPAVVASSTTTRIPQFEVLKKGGTVDNSFQKMILATIKENNKKIENLSKTMTNYFKDIKKK